MGIVIPDAQRTMDDGTNTVSWSEFTGATEGDYFYIAVGLPTYAAVLGSGTQPTAVVGAGGTRITFYGPSGSMDTGTTYHVVAFHGPGMPRRFA